MGKVEDKYTNVLTAKAIESVAGTLTFTEISLGISLGAGKGILVDHIDYFIKIASFDDMTVDLDTVEMGWATRNSGTLVLTDSSVIDAQYISRIDLGAAATGYLIQQPFSAWFSPPMIVATPKIFLGVKSTGLANPTEVTSRLFFRYIDLSSQEYLEIAETFLMVG